MNELRKKIEAVLAPLRMAEVVGEPIEGAWVGIDVLRSLQQEVDAGCEAEKLRAAIENLIIDLQQNPGLDPLTMLERILDQTAEGSSTYGSSNK
jgi:hypothetical protein